MNKILSGKIVSVRERKRMVTARNAEECIKNNLRQLVITKNNMTRKMDETVRKANVALRANLLLFCFLMKRKRHLVGQSTYDSLF